MHEVQQGRFRDPQLGILEQPPPIEEACDDRVDVGAPGQLVQDEHAARPQHGVHVTDRRPDIGSSMDDVGGDDDIRGPFGETLRCGGCRNIQSREANARKVLLEFFRTPCPESKG